MTKFSFTVALYTLPISCWQEFKPVYFIIRAVVKLQFENIPFFASIRFSFHIIRKVLTNRT